jgi:hypothetical protein
MPDHTLIAIEIGGKDHLTHEALLQAGLGLFAAAVRVTNPAVLLMVFGYDDDPRELHEIPEAADYIREFAKLTTMNNHNSKWFKMLVEDSKAVLLACDAVDKPHPYTVVMPDGQTKQC